ncbi:hypothetical protein J7E26_02350 [Bacillus sp. ISL-51]|uniref:hypothetical protein n=1 Tax=Bacteria TaxID=2 RepID=UPI001BEAB99D|nr:MULTISPECIES: hypothetical protein [Bacteria]MBT2572801.1 hypothetical protein [Bacillus sp. ISL-51]MBT2635474.1 hypothetical protein [Bacillus sp. ISL-26]MBT2713274.1 hypothetical protein [Pseudomonas sp. ISL-88]
MKKILIILSILCIISACEKNYTGTYTELGDTLTESNKKCFKENQIPYKIDNGKVYIPEDAFDIAIKTCS